MKYALALFFIIANFICKAQVFEGTLIYDVAFELSPKLSKITTKESFLEKTDNEELQSSRVSITYKDGNYYLASEGSKYWAVYRKDSNRLYSFFPAKEDCIITDVSKDMEFELTGKLPMVKLIDTIAFIENKPCKILRVQWKAGYYDYYFCSNYLINNENLFPGYVYDGWNAYLSIAKAYPLKIVKVTKGFYTQTYTLIKATPRQVSNKLFEIPLLKESSIPSFVPNKKIMLVAIENTNQRIL